MEDWSKNSGQDSRRQVNYAKGSIVGRGMALFDAARWIEKINRKHALGLIGQGGSFVAMLVPLVFSPHQAITSFVVAAAIANTVMPFANLGLPMSYPSIRDPRRAASAVKASFGTTVLISLAALLPEVVTPNWGPSTYLAAASPLICLTSLDSTMIAWLVRTNNVGGIMENRFKYGMLNVVVTVPICILSDWRWSLVASSSIVYVLTMIWVCSARRVTLAPELRAVGDIKNSEVIKYLLRGLSNGSSYSLAAGATQIMNLATGSFGPLSAPWAAASTICGGFATVVAQFMTPSVNARVADAVRNGRKNGIVRTMAAGSAVGSGVAAVAVCVSGIAGILLGFFSGVPFDQKVVFFIALALFWGGILATAPIFHVLSLLGRRKVRLAWDVVRLLCLTLIVFAVPADHRLLAMAVVSAFFFMIYMALSLWIGRRGEFNV